MSAGNDIPRANPDGEPDELPFVITYQPDEIEALRRQVKELTVVLRDCVAMLERRIDGNERATNALAKAVNARLDALDPYGHALRQGV